MPPKKRRGRKEAKIKTPEIRLEFGPFLTPDDTAISLLEIPSLHEYPEKLEEDVKVELMKRRSGNGCWEYNFPVNYNYLPMHKVTRDGEEFRMD